MAVVVGRVAAAVPHHDRVLDGHFVEVLDVQLALVLDLRVVEEVALDPRAGRRLPRLGAELVDDAGDGDELHLEGIAHEHFVEEGLAAGVIVGVGEPRNDGHPAGVEDPGVLADEPLDVGGASHGGKPSGLHRKRLGPRRSRIHRVDVGVEDHQIRARRFWRRLRCCSRGLPLAGDNTDQAGAGQPQKFSTSVAVVFHGAIMRPSVRELIRAGALGRGPSIEPGVKCHGRFRVSESGQPRQGATHVRSGPF